jgi:fatty acid desaturase
MKADTKQNATDKRHTPHKPNKTLKMGSQKMVLACFFFSSKILQLVLLLLLFLLRGLVRLLLVFLLHFVSRLLQHTQSVQEREREREERESARETRSTNNNTVKGETGKQTKPAAESPRR